MEIAVCAGEVLFGHDLRLAGDDGKVEGLAMPDPAGEAAVELATDLRGRGVNRVILLAVTPPEAEETLAAYLGLGAERLVRVWDACLAGADAHAVSLVLQRAVERLGPRLVLCGDRAVGGDGSGLTGPALAERLGWPFIGGVVALEPGGEDTIVAHRLVERGDRLVIECPLPAVLAVSTTLECSRYPAYARIQSGARAALTLDELGLTADDVHSAAVPLHTGNRAFARPRPRRLFAPPSTASATERLRMVMGGGAPRKGGGSVIEEPPERAAEQILQFLRQEGIV